MVEVDDAADAVAVAGQDQIGGRLRAGAGHGQDAGVLVQLADRAIAACGLAVQSQKRTVPSSLPETISFLPLAPARLTATHVTSA